MISGCRQRRFHQPQHPEYQLEHGGGGPGLHPAAATINSTSPGPTWGGAGPVILNNFAWGSLDLTGQTLTLLDGNNTPGGALYVGTILGVLLSGGQVTDIYGNGLDIYYDPSLAGNAYLGGLTYQLAGGGYLAPVTSDFLELPPLALSRSNRRPRRCPAPSGCS